MFDLIFMSHREGRVYPQFCLILALYYFFGEVLPGGVLIWVKSAQGLLGGSLEVLVLVEIVE